MPVTDPVNEHFDFAGFSQWLFEIVSHFNV